MIEPLEEEPHKLPKIHHVMVDASEAQLIEPIATLQRKRLGYSLTGITSGVVKKRPEGTSGKTCGLFAKDWPEWLTVESAFDVELSWVS
jgi:hypothetical protein